MNRLRSATLLLLALAIPTLAASWQEQQPNMMVQQYSPMMSQQQQQQQQPSIMTSRPDTKPQMSYQPVMMLREQEQPTMMSYKPMSPQQQQLSVMSYQPQRMSSQNSLTTSQTWPMPSNLMNMIGQTSSDNISGRKDGENFSSSHTKGKFLTFSLSSHSA